MMASAIMEPEEAAAVMVADSSGDETVGRSDSVGEQSSSSQGGGSPFSGWGGVQSRLLTEIMERRKVRSEASRNMVAPLLAACNGVMEMVVWEKRCRELEERHSQQMFEVARLKIALAGKSAQVSRLEKSIRQNSNPREDTANESRLPGSLLQPDTDEASSWRHRAKLLEEELHRQTSLSDALKRRLQITESREQTTKLHNQSLQEKLKLLQEDYDKSSEDCIRFARECQQLKGKMPENDNRVHVKALSSFKQGSAGESSINACRLGEELRRMQALLAQDSSNQTRLVNEGAVVSQASSGSPEKLPLQPKNEKTSLWAEEEEAQILILAGEVSDSLDRLLHVRNNLKQQVSRMQSSILHLGGLFQESQDVSSAFAQRVLDTKRTFDGILKEVVESDDSSLMKGEHAERLKEELKLLEQAARELEEKNRGLRVKYSNSSAEEIAEDGPIEGQIVKQEALNDGSDLNALRGSIQELESVVASLRKENSELQCKALSQFEEELRTKGEQLVAMEKESKRSTELLKALEEQAAHLMERLANAHESSEQLEKEAADLRGQKKILEEEMTLKADYITQLLEEVKRMQVEGEEAKRMLRQSHERWEREKEATMNEKMHKGGDLNGTKETEANRGKSEQLLVELSAKVKELEGLMAGMKEERSVIEAEVALRMDRVNQMEAEVLRLRQENEGYQMRSQKWGVEVQGLEDEVQTLQTQNQHLSEEVCALAREEKRFLVTLRFTRAHAFHLLQKTKELRGNTDSLSSTLTKLQKEKEDVLTQLASEKIRGKELEQEASILREENSRQSALLLDRAEEKREAIRQLCFTLNMLQEKNKDLVQALASIRANLTANSKR